MVFKNFVLNELEKQEKLLKKMIVESIEDHFTK